MDHIRSQMISMKANTAATKLAIEAMRHTQTQPHHQQHMLQFDIRPIELR